MSTWNAQTVRLVAKLASQLLQTAGVGKAAARRAPPNEAGSVRFVEVDVGTMLRAAHEAGRRDVIVLVYDPSTGEVGTCVVPLEPRVRVGSIPLATRGLTLARDESQDLLSPLTAADALEAHAVARWATAVVRIVDCPTDLRTIGAWSRWAAMSSGALRCWCYTAGIGPRRSLVFGRILRAVVLRLDGTHRLEDLLDVVDRRTLVALVKFAGFGEEAIVPTEVAEFLDRQVLVRDPNALARVREALGRRGFGSTASEAGVLRRVKTGMAGRT